MFLETKVPRTTDAEWMQPSIDEGLTPLPTYNNALDVIHWLCENRHTFSMRETLLRAASAATATARTTRATGCGHRPARIKTTIKMYRPLLVNVPDGKHKPGWTLARTRIWPSDANRGGAVMRLLPFGVKDAVTGLQAAQELTQQRSKHVGSLKTGDVSRLFNDYLACTGDVLRQ